MNIERYASRLYFLGTDGMRALFSEVACSESARRRKSEFYADLLLPQLTHSCKRMLEENSGELLRSLRRMTAYEGN
jgi:hypothetical protein